jgi:3-methyl-2-oxobutanoate hydroxymethyltransferase
MLTAYDYPTALAMDKAGVDSILVGDSLAMVVLGYENTLPVTMDEMLHHCRAVSRSKVCAAHRRYAVHVVSSFRGRCRPQRGALSATTAAWTRSNSKAGANGRMHVRSIVNAGIPVMGHLGLTPQSCINLAGSARRAKPPSRRNVCSKMRKSSKKRAFSLVLESVPARLAEYDLQTNFHPHHRHRRGAGCDGQVLVTHDLLGLFERFTPKFVKKYANFHGEMQKAFGDFIEDVESKRFPALEHTVEMEDKEWESLQKELA